MNLPPFHTLTIAEKVAQLIVVRASGHLFDRQICYPQWEACQSDLQTWIDQGVGGVILLGGSAAELALRTQQLQTWSKIPLFLAADVEEGVGQRFAGASWLPPPLAFGSIARANLAQGLADVEAFGEITAQEARAIGLNWILAPVVDVNNNPLNPVINVRSFGETPEEVCVLTQAFLRGCQRHSVLTTAKHFPGHGDTAVDSHLELPQILHDRSRLEAVEWKPFRTAIEAGVSSIMTAHLLLPALDAEYPATLSRPILTNLLRESWHFEGLIVTDALIMQAITQHYGETEAPLLALEAGADVILMPVNPTKTIEAMVEAVHRGRLLETRIDQSLARIWKAKRSLKTIAEPISQRLDSLERSPGDGLTRSILKRSQRIRFSSAPPQAADPLLNQALNDHSTQTRKLPDCRNLILVDNLLQVPFLGNHTPAVRIPQKHGYHLQILDQTSHSPQSNMLINNQPNNQSNFVLDSHDQPHHGQPHHGQPHDQPHHGHPHDQPHHGQPHDQPHNQTYGQTHDQRHHDQPHNQPHNQTYGQNNDQRHHGQNNDQTYGQNNDQINPQIHCPPTLLQLFIRGNPFRGSGQTSPWMQQWLIALLELNNLQALIVYGSPYSWESLITHFPPEIPSIFTYGQMPLAQEIALQTIFDRLFETGLGQNKTSTLNPIEFTT